MLCYYTLRSHQACLHSPEKERLIDKTGIGVFFCYWSCHWLSQLFVWLRATSVWVSFLRIWVLSFLLDLTLRNHYNFCISCVLLKLWKSESKILMTAKRCERNLICRYFLLYLYPTLFALRENSIWAKENLYYIYSLREFFFATKKNIFSSSVYFFTLKTHILKVKTLFFDLNMIFLIVNTFSIRL